MKQGHEQSWANPHWHLSFEWGQSSILNFHFLHLSSKWDNLQFSTFVKTLDKASHWPSGTDVRLGHLTISICSNEVSLQIHFGKAVKLIKSDVKLEHSSIPCQSK